MTSGRKAGRPKGVPNRQSKEQVKSAKAGGIMPLGAMLKGMRFWSKIFDEEAKKDPEAVDNAGWPAVLKRPDMALMEKALDKMLAFAAQAAPYVHARLSAQAHFLGEDGDKLKAFLGARDRLEALINAAEQGLPMPLPPVVKTIEHQAGEPLEDLLTEKEAEMIAGTVREGV